MRKFFVDQFLPALSRTLFHSIWEGLVVSVMAGIVILLTRRSLPAVRYTLLTSLLFLFLTGTVISFLVEMNSGSGAWNIGEMIGGSNSSLTSPSHTGSWLEWLTGFLTAHAEPIVFIWCLVFLFKLCRMILDMLYVRRLRYHHTFSVDSYWINRMQTLSKELGIGRTVLLVESALVKVPTVIGHFKPLILFPASIFTQIPPGELEAILLHELAHIRRSDYLVNFIQRFCELVFFFNPGLLWISSLIRIERENCCDDVAIYHTSDKALLVEALIRCKERSIQTPTYALGLFDKPSVLMQRLSRIVYNRNKTLSFFETGFFALSLVVIAALLLSVSGSHPSPGLSVTPAFTQSRPSVKVPDIERTVSENLSHRAAKKITKSRVKVNTSSPFVWPPSPPEAIPQAPPAAEPLQALAELQKQRAEKDRAQADLDRAQALKDQAQAERDREQANKDRQQAERDRIQAERDREQAFKDRLQAESDRIRAEKDRLHNYQQ